MSEHDTGGPAYPRPYSTNGLAEDGPDVGMTLLDWFAGKAACGLVDGGLVRGCGFGDTEIARNAYNIAAALIAEKRRREGGE